MKKNSIFLIFTLVLSCAVVLLLSPVRSQCGNAEQPADDTLQPQASASAMGGSGWIAGWGANTYHQGSPPTTNNNYVAIAAGGYHSVALRSDGSIEAWGNNVYGQRNAPTGTNYVAIAAGNRHSLALKSNGSVVGWGDNTYGETNPQTGSQYVAIAAGDDCSIALKSDGSIVVWGDTSYGLGTPPTDNDYVAIAAGGHHGIALRSNGLIAVWGDTSYGLNTPPSGQYIAIAAGYYHGLALNNLGYIVGWGFDGNGEIDSPTDYGYVAIAAGYAPGLALKPDGSIVGWGSNSKGQASPPTGHKYVAIASGGSAYHSLALFGYEVRASVSGGNGSVSPAVQPVAVGGSATVNITPDAGYRVASIIDNSVAMPATLSYVISKAVAGHIIVVSFEPGCDSPSITTDPQNQTIGNGDSATLAVVAVGMAPLHYQWYQGTYPYTSHTVGTDADSYSTGALTTTTSFWVRLSNTCGQTNSATATITVSGTGSGPTITNVTSKTSKAGSSATIYGTGFSTDKKKDVVYFGTKKVKNITKANTTSLKVTIPKVANGTYAVTVAVNGTSSNAVNFTVK